ncbi:hypothetical protein [Hymenobacter cavernae]|uniref:Uncharacterized protein n=1 Tax=Hymenobacter cavernae TaxID=2044852 RepID=A0ABQ1USG9_9BACT|nr:hypothetical protein [Hymenobacter cavernae]GGF23842.1 hypothetical protein GCM10011383_39370 [Hymenobacter cavernae]
MGEEWEYFISWYKLDREDGYLLWKTGDATDAIYTDADGRIPSFGSISQITEFAKESGITLVHEEPRLQNLDWAKNWLKNPRVFIDCRACLTAWNFFLDVAEGTSRRFAGQSGERRQAWRGKIYDKLFFGTSTGMLLAPPETPPYKPRWNKDERKFIAKVLTQGMQIFRRYVYWVEEV